MEEALEKCAQRSAVFDDKRCRVINPSCGYERRCIHTPTPHYTVILISFVGTDTVLTFRVQLEIFSGTMRTSLAILLMETVSRVRKL